MLKDVFMWGTSFPGLNLITIEAQPTAFAVVFTHGQRRHYAHPEFHVHNVVDVGRGAVTSACPTTTRKRASARLGEKECHRTRKARADVAVRAKSASGPDSDLG